MSAITNYLNHLIRTLEPAMDKAVHEIAKIVQFKARTSTLFKGTALRKAIGIQNNGSLSRTVLADKDYAGYVEYGNNQKGSYIYPVRAKALHFRINGQEIFAKKVRSHGPLPFMRVARDFAEKEAPKVINKALHKWSN